MKRDIGKAITLAWRVRKLYTKLTCNNTISSLNIKLKELLTPKAATATTTMKYPAANIKLASPHNRELTALTLNLLDLISSINARLINSGVEEPWEEESMKELFVVLSLKVSYAK